MNSPQFATDLEIQQYARMTFKQYGLADYSLEFNPKLKRTLGQADPWNKRVIMNPKSLSSLALFSLVLKHEICHLLDYKERGTFKNKNGRHDFHGKTFKAWCKKLKISHSTAI